MKVTMVQTGGKHVRRYFMGDEEDCQGSVKNFAWLEQRRSTEAVNSDGGN
ncbi:MAG: hypothetical protein Kow0070_14500 [Anaerolineales bacterium]